MTIEFIPAEPLLLTRQQFQRRVVHALVAAAMHLAAGAQDRRPASW